VHAGRLDAARIAEALGAGYDTSRPPLSSARRGAGKRAHLAPRCVRPGQPEIVSLSSPALLSGPTSVRMSRAERTLLRAIAPQKRIAIRAESAALRVYVVHLDMIGFAHKLEQLRAVITDMAVRRPVPMTVVAGDLNTFGPPGLQLWRRLGAAAARPGWLTSRARSDARTGPRRSWTRYSSDRASVRVSRVGAQPQSVRSPARVRRRRVSGGA